MPTKLTLEDIKNKLPSHLSIVESTFINTFTKARFIDSEYGEFEALPKKVFSGLKSHPDRAKNEFKPHNKLTIEDIKSRLPSHLTIDVSTYVDTHTKARFIDSEYGEFWAPPREAIKSKNKKRYEANRNISLEEAKKRLPDHVTVDETTYKGASIPCIFIDKDYGPWKSRLDRITAGQNHPKRGHASKKISIDNVISRLPNHVSIDSNTFQGVNYNARFIDSEYGEFWALVSTVIDKDRRHPDYKKDHLSKRTILAEDVQARCPEYVTLDKSTYLGTMKKARFIDSEYGEFWALPNTVIFKKSAHPLRTVKTSKAEIEIFDFLKENGLNCDKNVKFNKERQFEIDLYLPDYKIGIEHNGLYWHSDNIRENNYHLEKREYFESYGIKLLQFNSNEWLDATEIVKSMILSKLNKNLNKFQARKLFVKKIDRTEAKLFLESNHLMGFHPSSKSIGLVDDTGLLVSIFSYRKLNTGIEISRFCNKIHTSVAGGFSKLLSEASKIENPQFVQSFVDLRYADGKSLEKLNFINKSTTLGWKWTDGRNTFNRLKCRANMDHRKLSEKEYAKELGWFKIYDAGQRLFIKNLTGG